jgi:nucleoid DNA-binding protein
MSDTSLLVDNAKVLSILEKYDNIIFIFGAGNKTSIESEDYARFSQYAKDKKDKNIAVVCVTNNANIIDSNNIELFGLHADIKQMPYSNIWPILHQLKGKIIGIIYDYSVTKFTENIDIKTLNLLYSKFLKPGGIIMYQLMLHMISTENINFIRNYIENITIDEPYYRVEATETNIIMNIKLYYDKNHATHNEEMINNVKEKVKNHNIELGKTNNIVIENISHDAILKEMILPAYSNFDIKFNDYQIIKKPQTGGEIDIYKYKYMKYKAKYLQIKSFT